MAADGQDAGPARAITADANSRQDDVRADRDRGSAFAEELDRDRKHREKAKTLKPLRRLWPFIARYPGLIVLFLIFLVIASAMTLALPAAFRVLVDCGFEGATASKTCDLMGGTSSDTLSIYFLAGMAVALVSGLASALRYFFITKLGERVVADIRTAVFDRIVTLSPTFFADMRTGEVLSRLTTDTTLIQTVVTSSFSVAVRTLATTVGALILMVLVSWKLSLLVLGIGPLILGPILMFGRRVQRLSRSGQDSLADSSARASESLTAIETVQAFTREPQERERFAEAVEQTFSVAMARVRVRTVMTAILFSMVLSALIGVLWFGAIQVQAGALTPGAMTQFVMYSFIAVSGVGFLTETYAEIMRAAGATERLMELMAALPDIRSPDQPAKLPDPVAGTVRFEGVSFAYPSRPQTRVLDDVRLAIAPGETVALVGPSGAGKSTIFQLLLRFYDPAAGRILLDGVDLRAADLTELRSAFAIVQQNAPLFSGSVADNILYGRPGASRAEVEAAARAANADQFIQKLPDGYDTQLGESARQLSGGQRQRLAIARAILCDAPILLLDEATSNLDTESERLVHEAFERIASGRTTLVIAHRLSTVRSADRILVFDEGRLVDEGTHESLLNKGGLYTRLADRQLLDATPGSISAAQQHLDALPVT